MLKERSAYEYILPVATLSLASLAMVVPFEVEAQTIDLKALSITNEDSLRTNKISEDTKAGLRQQFYCINTDMKTLGERYVAALDRLESEEQKNELIYVIALINFFLSQDVSGSWEDFEVYYINYIESLDPNGVAPQRVVSLTKEGNSAENLKTETVEKIDNSVNRKKELVGMNFFVNRYEKLKNETTPEKIDKLNTIFAEYKSNLKKLHNAIMSHETCSPDFIRESDSKIISFRADGKTKIYAIYREGSHENWVEFWGNQKHFSEKEKKDLEVLFKKYNGEKKYKNRIIFYFPLNSDDGISVSDPYFLAESFEDDVKKLREISDYFQNDEDFNLAFIAKYKEYAGFLPQMMEIISNNNQRLKNLLGAK